MESKPKSLGWSSSRLGQACINEATVVLNTGGSTGFEKVSCIGFFFELARTLVPSLPRSPNSINGSQLL